MEVSLDASSSSSTVDRRLLIAIYSTVGTESSISIKNITKNAWSLQTLSSAPSVHAASIYLSMVKTFLGGNVYWHYCVKKIILARLPTNLA